MAKMFYSLEETAQKLGVSVEEVKALAQSGKLQQFRDRDKLMFKREQVDAMSRTTPEADDTDAPISLADSSDTDAADAIDLAEETKGPKRKEDPRAATGISVFDAGEVEQVDPSAQTQVTQPAVDEDELVLEGVGSGSGLLDLTRESDDTSLGAELLDEIYPSGESSDAKLETVPSSSGAFDSAVALEPSTSGLENIQGGASATQAAAAIAPSLAVAEVYDGPFSAFSSGMLFGAMIILIIGLIVGISSIFGVPSQLTSSLTTTPGTLMTALAVALGACLVFGLIGFFTVKMLEK